MPRNTQINPSRIFSFLRRRVFAMGNMSTSGAPACTPVEVAYNDVAEDARKFAEWYRDTAQHLGAWIDARAGDFRLTIDKETPVPFVSWEPRKSMNFEDVIYLMVGSDQQMGEGGSGSWIKLRPKAGATLLGPKESYTVLGIAATLRREEPRSVVSCSMRG